MKMILTAIALLLTLTACATITADGEQEISITTEPAGASCLLSSTQGQWVIETTPGSVAVPRAHEPLGVTCTLGGYAPQRALIESKTRGRAYGNILLGGIPAYVDAGTGKGYEYDPAALMLTLQPLAASPQ